MAVENLGELVDPKLTDNLKGHHIAAMLWQQEQGQSDKDVLYVGFQTDSFLRLISIKFQKNNR